jgi:hypothetical protein
VQAILAAAPTSASGRVHDGPNRLTMARSGQLEIFGGHRRPWSPLRYAERQDHTISEQATLCRLTGIAKDETLDERLRRPTANTRARGSPPCS